MSFPGTLRWSAAILLGIVLGSAPARPQSASSTLKGIVRDSAGKPVAKVVVQARSQGTGVLRLAETNPQGRYQIDLLTPGEWMVVAQIGDGRSSAPRTASLRLQEILTLDLTLEAALTERVSVSGERPQVDTSRIGGETHIGGEEVDSLPIAGRMAINLALLDSSVQATPPGDFYGERGTVFVVNGQSGRSNSFLVDGVDNNDHASGTTLNSFFSQQVIGEFVFLTHQYSPEFGRAGGGIMNIVTHRGTNERQGGGFAQGSFAKLNSPGDFVSGLPDSGSSSDTGSGTQVGFNLGGAFQPDRSFYYFAFEHQQSDDLTPYTGVNQDGVPGGWVIAPNRNDSLFFRTDFNLSDSNFLMLRFSGNESIANDVNVAGITTPDAGFHLEERDFQLAATFTSVVSGDILNEERVLVSHSTFDQQANSSLTGVERPSGIFGGNNLNSQAREESLIQLVDNVTWRIGSHTTKFGIDLSRSITDVATSFNPNGNFLYNTDAPFDTGDCGDIIAREARQHCSLDATTPCQFDSDCPGKGFCRYDPVPCSGDLDGDGTPNEPGLLETYPVVFQVIEGSPAATLDDKRLAFFAQDTWQASEKLLFNYGLRYDYSSYHLPEDARVPSTIPNGGADTDTNNIAPRFGFTYTPVPGRVVVRGGAGMFYDKLVLGFPAVAAITSGTKIGLIFPQGLAYELTEDTIEQYGIDAIKQELIFPDNLVLRFSTGTTLETPYVNQFNIGAEWAIGAHNTVEVDAVRALGYHIPLMRDLNPVVRKTIQGVPVHRDEPVGSIAAIVTEGRSWYSGLDLGWRWQNGRVWYSASYTISKSEDLGSDPLKGGISLPPDSDNIAGEKGRSDADHRHRLVLSGRAALPWWSLFASGVIQLASGAPFNVTTGRDGNLDGFTNDRPPGVGRNTGADTDLDAVNELRAADNLPPVNSLREPTFFQVDIRVSKPFGMGDDRAGEAYLQVFNLLNRFNGGPIEGRATSQDFGEPVGQVGPARILEFGVRLDF